jgi:ADP-ribosyl-[dinitrogen reductase] hydrolase
MHMHAQSRGDVLAGTLVGMLVGDALGLPRENLSRARGLKLFGGSPLGYRLVLGRGLGSDDTEHACMVAQALLAQPREVRAFARSLAWRLRGWLLSLPAGLGSATLRATVKLWLGFSPERSGVRSAGNGPAMRAPVLGACLAGQPELLERFLSASTRVTHRDALAEQGTWLVAQAAAYVARQVADGGGVEPASFLGSVGPGVTLAPLREALEAVGAALERRDTVLEFAQARGLDRGVTGYILHTVPVVLYAWLRYPSDFRAAVEAVILLGGDTDTTAAIVGGLVGTAVGVRGIPEEWRAGLVEWPRTVRWMERLAGRLAEQFPLRGEPEGPPGPLPLFWPGLLPRNLVLLGLVLGHGLRRLLPPY